MSVPEKIQLGSSPDSAIACRCPTQIVVPSNNDATTCQKWIAPLPQVSSVQSSDALNEVPAASTVNKNTLTARMAVNGWTRDQVMQQHVKGKTGPISKAQVASLVMSQWRLESPFIAAPPALQNY
jgi:hypothetical protein